MKLEKAAQNYRDLCDKRDAVDKIREEALAAMNAFEVSPEYRARKSHLDATWVESNRLRGVTDNAYLAFLDAARTGSSDLPKIADMYRRAVLHTDVAQKERKKAGSHLDALMALPENQIHRNRWDAANHAFHELKPLLDAAEQELLAAAMILPEES